jgi:hypothetical protein
VPWPKGRVACRLHDFRDFASDIDCGEAIARGGRATQTIVAPLEPLAFVFQVARDSHIEREKMISHGERKI